MNEGALNITTDVQEVASTSPADTHKGLLPPLSCESRIACAVLFGNASPSDVLSLQLEAVSSLYYSYLTFSLFRSYLRN